MSRRKPPKYRYCFSCRHSYPLAEIAQRGKRKDGKGWAVCRACHAAWRGNQELNRQWKEHHE